jgi:hypothetical protein
MGPSAVRSSGGASHASSSSASSIAARPASQPVNRAASHSPGPQSSAASHVQKLGNQQAPHVQAQAKLAQHQPGSTASKTQSSLNHATQHNALKPAQPKASGKSLPNPAQAAGYAGMAPKAKPIVPHGAGSSWVIRKVDVNPASSSPKAMNGAQGNPLRVGMHPTDLNSRASAAEHSMGLANKSPYLSTSSKPYGAPNFSAKTRPQSSLSHGPEPVGLKRSQSYLIDLKKTTNSGSSVVKTNQLVRDLNNHAKANGLSQQSVSTLKKTVGRLEGETLIKGAVPKEAISAPNKQHLKMIQQAENIYNKAKAQGGSADAIYKRAQPELRALEKSVEASSKLGSNLSKVGKGLGVVGAVSTAYELGKAGKESVDKHTPAPIAAEVVRQGGGWAGAWAGAQGGAALGAALGIETGPGAVVTGAVGGIIGGVAGFFAADKVADQIHPN